MEKKNIILIVAIVAVSISLTSLGYLLFRNKSDSKEEKTENAQETNPVEQKEQPKTGSNLPKTGEIPKSPSPPTNTPPTN
ncbi:hypothetical protein CWI39_3017p0010, partial [Hamiltosporidium magnivora]